MVEVLRIVEYVVTGYDWVLIILFSKLGQANT